VQSRIPEVQLQPLSTACQEFKNVRMETDHHSRKLFAIHSDVTNRDETKCCSLSVKSLKSDYTHTIRRRVVVDLIHILIS